MQSGLSPSNLGEIVLWVFRQRRRFRVTGHSMAPLLKPGDEVLVDPHAYRREPPQPGEIVLAQHPYQTDLRLIKRVSAVLEEDRYELKGDNPSESTDSRAFGGIARRQILGRVTSHFL
jgi:nickel-type superoxide dismutase maturation protease